MTVPPDHSQYDAALAAAYSGSLQFADLRSYVERPLVLDALGEVEGHAILDVGCGHGDYCRLLRRAGARRVVGVDNASEMLARARAAEARLPLGIEYRSCRAEELGRVGAFDAVLAVHLLHYARRRDDLVRMCAGLRANLVPGGVLVGVLCFVEDPARFAAGSNYDRYGLTLHVPPTLREGDPLTLDVRMETPFSFDMVQWRRETYEHALISAGFRSVTFTPHAPSPEAVERFGEDFWADYVEHSTVYVVRCPT